MNIYNYHPSTREYLGASEAKIDPRETAKAGENVYLIPANATTDQPPESGTNQRARRNGDDWELVDDYRGQSYWNKDTGVEITITELGITIPNDSPTQAPPAGMFNPVWNGSAWVESAIVFQCIKVKAKTDVDRITRARISNLGEEKAKTEKLLAGAGVCAIWDEFIAARAVILQEGDDFVAANDLS